jgi:hypothetical protein
MTTLDVPIQSFRTPTPNECEPRARTTSAGKQNAELDYLPRSSESVGDLIKEQPSTRIDTKLVDSYKRHFAEECAIAADEEVPMHRRLASDGSALNFVVPVLDDVSDLDAQSIMEKVNTPMEELLAVYGASWDHEGLPRAGRLFATAQHICFYAKSLGRKDKFVVHWKDVKQFEKKMTAGFVPNGLKIVTASTRYNLSNIGKRDQVFAKLFDLWTIASGPLQRDPRPLQVGTHQFVQLPRMSSIDGFDGSAADLLSPTPPPLMTPRSDGSLPIITITQESLQRLPGGFDHDYSQSPISMTDAVLTATDSILRYTGVSAWIPQVLKNRAREAALRVSQDSSKTPSPSPNSVVDNIDKKSPELLPLKLENPDRPESLTSAPIASPTHQKTTSYSSASSESPLSLSPELGPTSLCGCLEHYKHTVINEVFDGTLDQVVQAWFAEGGSTSLRETHDRIDTSDLKCGPWSLDPQGGWTKRTVEFMSTFKPPMLPKQQTPATEVQEVVRRSNAYVTSIFRHS